MNRNINKKHIKSTDGEVKNHQAYAMELSRLEKAKEICEKDKNCFEYNNLGGQNRHLELDNIVKTERDRDELRRKSQKDTNPNNMYQDEKSPTDVSVTDVRKKAEKGGNKINKILSNSQALSEEISNIKYLIEYMNNNKKQIL